MNPFAASATMKRLPLHDSHAASLTVASVDVETLQVVPRQRRFARLSARRWRYTSAYQAREVEANLDDFGLVVDEPGGFSRRAPGTPAS
jgi:hypothetical protein